MPKDGGILVDVSSTVNDTFADEEDLLSGDIVQSIVSPEDLLTMSLAEELEAGAEDENDLREINSMINELASIGIEHVDNLSYDDLSVLLSRVESLKDPEASIEMLLADTKEMMDSAVKDLVNIKATLDDNIFDADDTMEILKNISMNVQTTYGLDVQKFTNETIIKLYFEKKQRGEEPGKIGVDDVFHPVAEALAKSKFVIDTDSLVRYLNTVIPIIVSSIDNKNRKEETIKKHRKHTAILLLKKDLQDVQDMLALPVSEISIIKQMFHGDSGQYCYKCSSCGEFVHMTKTPLSVIVFPAERGGKKRFFPKLSKCKCGHNHVFLEQDYAEIAASYFSDNASLLNKSVQSVSNFCSGAAFVRIEPQLHLIELALPYLFSGLTIQSQKLEIEQIDDTDDLLTVNIDMQEFKDAVRRFYSKLEGISLESYQKPENREKSNSVDDMDFADDEDAIDEEDETDSCLLANEFLSSDAENILTWQIMAQFVCQCSGVNYHDEKNRAIFSLLSRIQENRRLSEMLDMRILWDMQMLCETIELLDKPLENYTIIEKRQLSSIAASFQKVNSGDLYDPGYMKYLWGIVNSKKSVLEAKIVKFRQKHVVAISGITRCKEEYGFSKILNIINYQLSDYDAFMGDAEFAALADEISDRMIVTNYSYEFFKYWLKLSFLQRSLLLKDLEKRSDVVNASEHLSKIVYKMQEKYLSGNIVQTNFDICFNYNSKLQSILFNLYVYHKTGNYYRFCREFTKLGRSMFDSLPYAIRSVLEIMYRQFYERADKISALKEYEFYLRDFSLEELDDKDILLNTLVFTRYIPKRLPDESLVDYVKRFKDSSNVWTSLNSYDTLEFFDVLDQYVVAICCWSNHKELELESYASSMFTYLLIKTLMPHGLEGFELLGGTKFSLNKLKVGCSGPLAATVSLCEDTYRVLHGDYVTSISDKITALANRYDNLTISTYDDIFNRESKFNIKNELINLYMMDYYGVDAEGVPQNDKEEGILEIEDNLSSGSKLTQKDIKGDD